MLYAKLTDTHFSYLWCDNVWLLLLLLFYLMCGVVCFPTNDLNKSPTIKSLSKHYSMRQISTFSGTTIKYTIVVVARWLRFINSLETKCIANGFCSVSCYISKGNQNVYAMRTLWYCIIIFFAYSHLHCGRLFGVIFVSNYSISSIDFAFFYLLTERQYWNSWNLPLFPFHHNIHQVNFHEIFKCNWVLHCCSAHSIEFVTFFFASFVCAMEWVCVCVCVFRIFGSDVCTSFTFVWWSMWTKTHILTSCFSGFFFALMLNVKYVWNL